MTEIEQQLIILRGALDAASASLNSLSVLFIKEDEEMCTHKKSVNISTMTEPGAWYCQDCNMTGGKKPIEEKEN